MRFVEMSKPVQKKQNLFFSDIVKYILYETLIANKSWSRALNCFKKNVISKYTVEKKIQFIYFVFEGYQL